MATGLHGSARTTPRVPAEIQASQVSTRALANKMARIVWAMMKWS